MDCGTVRERMDDGEAAGAIATHLELCAGCRDEAELGRRMAAAVAALPRVSAPEGLVDQVMAELGTIAPMHETAPRLPRLRLRAWEAGWLFALCVALLIGAWVLARGAAGMALRDTSVWLQAWVRDLLPALPHAAPDLSMGNGVVRETMAVVSGIPLSWLLGLVGFGLGLFWLLSWHGQMGPHGEWEDAHA